MWEAKQPQGHLLPIGNDEGCRGVGGPVPQDSGVGLRAKKLGVLGGPNPELSSFSSEGEGGALKSHLGPGGPGKECCSHFPGWTSDAGLGRAGPTGLRPGAMSSFPQCGARPRWQLPTHSTPALGARSGCSGSEKLQEPKPLAVPTTPLHFRRGQTGKENPARERAPCQHHC